MLIVPVVNKYKCIIIFNFKNKNSALRSCRDSIVTNDERTVFMG